MLTEEDIQKLSTILATKADLNDLTTKADLNDLATKEDLEALRTSTQAGFTEVKGDIQEIRSDVDALRTTMQLGFSEVKEEIEALRESVQISLVTSDKTAKAVADLQEEYHGITAQLSNHDGTIRELAKKADISLSY